MSAWHPKVGACVSSFEMFSTKPARDYAASTANKHAGYIDHSIGQFKPTRKPVVYWLHIYFKAAQNETR